VVLAKKAPNVFVIAAGVGNLRLADWVRLANQNRRARDFAKNMSELCDPLMPNLRKKVLYFLLYFAVVLLILG